MQATGTRRKSATAGILAFVLPLFIASTVFAQGATRHGARSGPRRPGPSEPNGPKTVAPPVTPGNLTGRILKFKPVEEGEGNEGLAGYLLVKPFEKGAKLLKLSVFKPDADVPDTTSNAEAAPAGVVVRVGDHQFESEDYAELFWKGLYCTAGWGFKDEKSPKPKIKELRVLTFDPIDVEGKVDKVEDDTITLKVIPRNGVDWPHLAALEKSRTNMNPGSKPKRVRTLKVDLKVIEDVSKITDADGEETSLSSFEPGQAIHARIVYSQKIGMLLKLSPPNAAEASNPPPREPEQPRGGGRNPPGGRPRRGPVGGG